MSIQQLSEIMGVSEADVIRFVECLRVWTNKGLTLDEAIQRHMGQMVKLANNALHIARTEAGKTFVVDTFYPENV